MPWKREKKKEALRACADALGTMGNVVSGLSPGGQRNGRKMALQRRGPFRAAGFPGRPGPFLGAAGVGEAAEAGKVVSLEGTPWLVTRPRPGRAGPDGGRTLWRWELAQEGPAAPGGTSCPRDPSSSSRKCSSRSGRPLRPLRGSYMGRELNWDPVSRACPDHPSGFPAQCVDCPGTTFSIPELGL